MPVSDLDDALDVTDVTAHMNDEDRLRSARDLSFELFRIDVKIMAHLHQNGTPARQQHGADGSRKSEGGTENLVTMAKAERHETKCDGGGAARHRQRVFY